jgi:hypothetical protein
MDRKDPEVGWGPDANEPKSERITGRDFAGASYGANEKEQTDDLRGVNSEREADVDDGGISEVLDDNGKL